MVILTAVVCPEPLLVLLLLLLLMMALALWLHMLRRRRPSCMAYKQVGVTCEVRNFWLCSSEESLFKTRQTL